MRSWCFDSQATTSGGVTTYDREYGTEEIREVIGKLIGNGVYANPSTNMQVIADSGLTVKVQPGFCWIKGAFGAIDTPESLALESSPSGRTDLVVARFDLSLSYRSIRLAVIKGTNGSTASPTLTRNNSVYDIQLAKINVRAGTTSIAQSDISDTRYNNTVCGIVTGVINQIDTANLFAQYQASFNAFMEELEDTLSGDVAGNLLQLINSHKNDTNLHASLSEKETWNGKAEGAHNHKASEINNGILSTARGGTGQGSLQASRNVMGLGNTLGALPIANGGTGSTSEAGARSNLGAAPSGYGVGEHVYNNRISNPLDLSLKTGIYGFTTYQGTVYNSPLTNMLGHIEVYAFSNVWHYVRAVDHDSGLIFINRYDENESKWTGWRPMQPVIKSVSLGANAVQTIAFEGESEPCFFIADVDNDSGHSRILKLDGIPKVLLVHEGLRYAQAEANWSTSNGASVFVSNGTTGTVSFNLIAIY